MIKQVNVAILVVDEQVCADEWSGVVRREDVRATEKEKVIIGENFRVGDLIRGEVVCGNHRIAYASLRKTIEVLFFDRRLIEHRSALVTRQITILPRRGMS